MLNQREELRNVKLFRILKTKGPVASKLCKKLKQNVKNIILLSESELCVLWRYVKAVLLEAQKLYTQSSNDTSKYMKDYSLTINLIRTINAMALETVRQRTFTPNVLLEIVMILHSVILPRIKDKQVKDEISSFLEHWWMLDLVWRDKAIINVLKYLIQNCESSLQHIKRLHDVKSAVVSLKPIEDVQALLRLVRKKTVMLAQEGRTLILYLFSLGEEYILGIHNNVKIMLESVTPSFVVAYAKLYAVAWMNATEKLKKVIAENCVQDIIFHRLRTFRDSTDGGTLNKNLMTFLNTLHNNKNDAVRKMVFSQYKPLLWKHLKAAGSHVRCNVAEVLFLANPMDHARSPKSRGNENLQKYYNAMTDLLKDPHYQVCSIAMNGTFKILEKHWSSIPNNVIIKWLNILSRHTKKTNNSEIRIGVFVGLKEVLINKSCHSTLKMFLPNFADSIYDVDTNVVDALLKLLWHAQNNAGIPFWDVVPLPYVLDRLETMDDSSLLRQLLKFVWLRISTDSLSKCKAEEEIMLIGINNVNAVRKLCFHSKYAINWNVTLKLIKTILGMIEKEIEPLFPINDSKESCVKKLKINHKKNLSDSESTMKYTDDEDFYEYQNVHILIDVAAMLLLANEKNIKNRKFYEEGKNILLPVANLLQKCSMNFKNTPVNDSVIFLFSLVTPKLFEDEITVMEMLLQQLRNPDISDDTILTITHVFVKWEKTDRVLSLLTDIFTESVNERNWGPDSFNLRERRLELCLRIVKHLFHVEHWSHLINKYHGEMLKFWEKLDMIKSLVQEQVEGRVLDDSLSGEVVVSLFKEYMSMVPLLHKMDVFDATEHYSEIVTWIRRVVVPCIPNIDATEKHETPINILKFSFDISNQMVKQNKVTPKLCCDIVLLYCSCISVSAGIVFANDVFHAIVTLLEYGAFAYRNKETRFLSIIIPNFVCAAMITLTRYSEIAITTYTNNLNTLPGLIRKYFLVTQSTFKNREMHLSYITIMFNTAVSSISTEMTCRLQSTAIMKESVLLTTFPYLAEKILKIILQTQKYQEFSLQVLTKTITSYTKIDVLSALLIIRKILTLPVKAPVKRLKNITLAVKLHNEKQLLCTPFERSIDSAITIVIEAILQQ